ncbi:MAG: type II toxin-antitoxin system VapC family toxin [Actinomycetota bacterium]|nr:type II toxin-antitoxin system VapC family toxin [Actinomycetota bacterium]
MIYLDTSALLKLVRREAETDALSTWLLERVDVPKITSALTRIELLQATRRLDSSSVGIAIALLGGIDVIPVSAVVIDVASELDHVRSLDAIHLASALSINDGSLVMLTYDARLRDASLRIGVCVETPGA